MPSTLRFSIGQKQVTPEEGRAQGHEYQEKGVMETILEPANCSVLFVQKLLVMMQFNVSIITFDKNICLWFYISLYLFSQKSFYILRY